MFFESFTLFPSARSAVAIFCSSDWEGALAATEAARELDATRYEAEASAAVILHAAGRPVEARAALARAQRLAPPDQQGRLDRIARVVGDRPQSGQEVASGQAHPAALSGPVRRQWDAPLLIMEEADGAVSQPQRRQLLEEFLERSDSFSKGNPDHFPVWLLRAAAALELEREGVARQADRQLTRLGAEELEDQRIRQVMAMLQSKGWVDDGAAEPEGPLRSNGLAQSHVIPPRNDRANEIEGSLRVDQSAAAQRDQITSDLMEGPKGGQSLEGVGRVDAGEDVPRIAHSMPTRDEVTASATVLFADRAKQEFLESMCGDWRWSDISGKSDLHIAANGSCKWTVRGWFAKWQFEGRILDVDLVEKTLLASLRNVKNGKTDAHTLTLRKDGRIRLGEGNYRRQQ